MNLLPPPFLRLMLSDDRVLVRRVEAGLDGIGVRPDPTGSPVDDGVVLASGSLLGRGREVDRYCVELLALRDLDIGHRVLSDTEERVSVLDELRRDPVDYVAIALGEGYVHDLTEGLLRRS